MFTLDSDIVGL